MFLTISFSTMATVFGDVSFVRYSTAPSGKEINLLKGLGPLPKISKNALPKMDLGRSPAAATDQTVGKSYLSCETRNGQKFSEGQFGYAECLNEKKDQSRSQGITPPPPGAGPSLESLRINLDHTFSF